MVAIENISLSTAINIKELDKIKVKQKKKNSILLLAVKMITVFNVKFS